MEAYDLKDSGVDWLGRIPKHWQCKPLKRYCVKTGTGRTPDTGNSEYYSKDTGIKWFSPECFDTRKFLDIPKKFITNKALEDGQAKIYSENSVYLVGIGATAGKVSISIDRCSANQQINILETSFKLNPDFLYYQLKIIEKEISIFSQYTTLPIINKTKTGYIPICVPFIEEQKAIANHLDKACQNIDKTLILKQQQLDKLEAYRKSVIHEAVTKGLDKTVPMKDSGVDWLGDIPIHWGIDRLKDVSHLREEKTANKSLNKDYLELEDLSQWTGKILNKRNTLEVASQVNVFYKGDVLFGKLRPYLAKYTYADFNGKCTGEILAIKPTRIYGGFLAYYVGSKHFINHCDNFSYGAKMPRINWNTQMGIFPIPIPLLFEEQRIIVDYLDKACTNIDKTKETITNQIKTLTQYRQSLIHECVTGKKRIYQGVIKPYNR